MKYKKILFVSIEIILFAILVFSMYKIVTWFLENNETDKILSIIDEYVEIVDVGDGDEKSESLIVNFEALSQINDDTVAYLKIDNTYVSYPVVQYTNNEFYLTKSYDKTYNSSGWIFADYKNFLDGFDKNLIIYGHNRKNDSMFGTLDNLLNESYYNDYNNIQFITENEYYEYQIFSVYTIEAEDYYIKTDFSDGSFGSFVDTIKNRSLFDFGIIVDETDNILTLSTCNTDSSNRIVIHAKKI